MIQLRGEIARPQSLSQTIARAAAKLPGDSATRQLLSSFAVCGNCSKFQRLGEAHDGGYLTCMDGLGDVSGILSVGVQLHDGWSSMAQRLLGGVPVGQFDCTVSEGADCGRGCTFHRKCLRSRDDREHFTLGPSVTLREAADLVSGVASGGALLGKIDIEGSEWPIFEAETRQELRRFRQLVVEFHGLGVEKNHRRYAAAMRNLLDAGFRVVHLHGNNCCGMYSPAPGLKIPRVVEVTFFADAPAMPHCSLAADAGPLDAPNVAKAPELPPAQLG